MNPLQPGDDFYFQISSSDNYYSLPILTTTEDKILHDPVMDDGTGGTTLPCSSTQKGSKGKQRKQLSLPASAAAWGTEDNYKNTTDVENKKWMHREIEKQRRQEMARLCTSFRSLLPFEYIKVN